MPNSKTLTILVTATVTLGFGQQSPPCHKGHQPEGYRMTPMPAPPLRTGLGATALRMTTKSDQAQTYFRQGVELLHCFWEFEAYRAFKEAARLDPDAAMAYWGIVQTTNDYPAMKEERDAALEKVKALLPKASDHEQYYLRALEKQQGDEGEDGYRSEMEALIEAYPDDADAKLFLALSLKYGYGKDGRPAEGHGYAVLLVEDVLSRDPTSAAANHYLIHILEAGPHADQALHAAESLGKLAPDSGHMVHMPGHIYYKLGDQERARQSFLDSMHTDADYMRREKVSPVDDWNYAHNLSYLIASDAEAGRYREALDMAATLEKLPVNPFLGLGKPLHAITIGGATVRLQLRFGDWQQVIDHPVWIGDAEAAGPAARAYRDGLIAYARGRKALEDHNLDEARHQADALDALQWRLNLELHPDNSSDKPERVFELLETASLDLRGNLQCAGGDLEGGIELLKKAIEKEKEVGYNEPPQYSRPEAESLGYACLQGGRFDEARQAFEDELKLRPNSGHALYGIALAFEKAGKRPEAREAYRKFLEAWKNADPDLPMVRHARSQTAPG